MLDVQMKFALKLRSQIRSCKVGCIEFPSYPFTGSFFLDNERQNDMNCFVCLQRKDITTAQIWRDESQM